MVAEVAEVGGWGRAIGPAPGSRRLRWSERNSGRSGVALDWTGRAAHASGPHRTHAPGLGGRSEGLVTPILSLVAAALFALQGAEVTASVDRSHLTVGEELMLTVRTQTRSAEPVELLLPPLNGFAIIGSR